MSETEVRHCKQCDKILHGRSDQVYCNDTCRNTYNKHKIKQQRIAPHSNQKAIFKILSRNYEILKGLSGLKSSTFRDVPIEKSRISKDFNPKFYTSSVTNKMGTWYICFDRGWRETDTHFIVSDFYEQGNL